MLHRKERVSRPHGATLSEDTMATKEEALIQPEPRKLLSGPPIKLSWSAIFGGVVAALGIWTLLYAFGLAIGLSAINPNDPSSAKGSGIFTGVWGVFVPLVALFIGGAVAGRGAGLINRAGGGIHGLVVWGVTTIFGAFLVGNLIMSAIGGIAQVGAGAVKSGGNILGQQGQGAARAFGIDANGALGPINQRLREEGKPEVTANQLQAATRDVVQSALRTGSIDRETLVTSIANETALSRQDAEELADRIDAQFRSTARNVRTGALQAADTTGKAFWGVFGALLLGLISAVIGGTVGVSRRQQREAMVGETLVVEPTRTSVNPPKFPPQPLHQ